jgi:hypothetical protein
MTTLVLLVVYWAKKNSFGISIFTGLSFVALVMTSAYGLSSSIYTSRISGSVNYDYGSSGSEEVIKLLVNEGVSSATVIGPLEIVYNIPGLQRFSFVNVVFSAPELVRKRLAVRPLILISTTEIERRLYELHLSGLNNPQRVEIKGSYTIRWYNFDTSSKKRR